MPNSIYLAKVGTLQTARVDFVEDATSVSHTASVPLPAGSVIQDIYIYSRANWGDDAVTMDIGDTADPNGYLAAFPMDDAEVAAPQVGSWLSNTFNAAEAYGAYCLAAADRPLVGPTSNNFGWNYVAGSNLIITINVTTPSATTGRTTVVVYYTVPVSIPIVST